MAITPLEAHVIRVEIESHEDVLNGQPFGDAGAYERVTGQVYFSVRVDNFHNTRIVFYNGHASLIIAGCDVVPARAARGSAPHV